MKASAWLGILLGVILVAAAGTIFVVARNLHRTGEGHGRGQQALADDPAAAVALDAWTARGELHLARTPRGWASPSGPVAKGEVERLLAALAALRRRETMAQAGEANLSWYGLEHPRVRVSLTLPGGTVRTLALGQSQGQDGAMFAMVDGGDVMVIASDTGAELEAHLAALQGGAPPLAGPRPPN